ncbi:MAG: FG-GAP-like repeat-containing protein [Sandaracinaceae bacterium]
MHRTSSVLALALLSGCTIVTPIGMDPPDGSVDGGACVAPCAGACCGAGELCMDGVCTLPSTPDGGARCPLSCGPSLECCADDEECVGDRCLPSCAGARCGATDMTCCGEGTFCVNDTCEDPGERCVTDADCASGDACEPLLGRCLPIPTGEVCRFLPPPDDFRPYIEWETRAGGGVLSHPVVTQLNDDDGDGEVTARDIPDIVFHGSDSLSSTIVFDRRMWAVSGDGSGVLWHSQDGYKVCPESIPAVADLDADGTVEVATLVSEAAEQGACGGALVGSSEPTPIYAAVFDHEGNLEWRSPVPVNDEPNGGSVSRQPTTVADLDGDGFGEVIVNGFVFDHLGDHLWTGARLRVNATGWGVGAAIADLDGDGLSEVLGPSVAYRYDGTEIWHGGAVAKGGVAIGNVVPTAPGPQLVVTGMNSWIVRDALTGAPILGPLSSGPGGDRIPHPVIADFDGDGQSELGVSSNHWFAIVDPADYPTAPHVRWEITTMPAVGRVGVTVFDFDGDGQSEVVLASYCHVRVLDGVDGALLWSTPNTATNSSQYAVVADVDGDFNAELVTMSDYAGDPPGLPSCVDDADLPFDWVDRGMRVWGDHLDHWVATRRTWNELGYHLDNVSDEGALPRVAEARWSTHNTYRVQQLPDPSTATLAPDLTLTSFDADRHGCPGRITLRARVQNVGARGVAAGVQVAFYRGEPGASAGLLGVAQTQEILLPGDGAWVELVVDHPALSPEGTMRLHAVVDDDGTGVGIHAECDETDNVAPAVTLDCSGLI